MDSVISVTAVPQTRQGERSRGRQGKAGGARSPPGVKAMPPAKRGRAEAETAEELRRTKSKVDEAIAEFVCPICQSLPVDPVMAEDGK